MTRSIPWPRILAEGFAIVVSILLAFGIQAWWEERQEREEEQRLLRNLHEDFLDAREMLAAGVDVHRRHFEAAGALARRGGIEEDTELLGAVYRVLVGYTTTHLPTGTLDGALASGALGLISSDELRSRLAAWPRTLSEFTEQEAAITQLVARSGQALASAAPIADLLIEIMVPEADPLQSIPPRFQEFVTSDDGRNLAALRLEAESYAVRDGDILLSGLDRILTLLESEIR